MLCPPLPKNKWIKIVTCDTWHVTDMWHMTCYTRNVTCDTSHVRSHTWHVLGGEHSLKFRLLRFVIQHTKKWTSQLLDWPGPEGWVQSLTNNFFGWTNTNMNITQKRHILQIPIWILLRTPCVKNMKKKTLIVKNIHKYIWIHEFIWTFEEEKINSKVTATYKPEDCVKDIKNFCDFPYY